MYRVIIIAEDFPTRQNLIRDIPWLEQDCEVVAEASGTQTGMALVLQTKPDILVVDTHLPDGSGLAFWESVREKVSCACIFISNFADFDLVQEALHLGAQGYLLKPILPRPFLKVLSKTVQAVQQKRSYEKSKELMMSASVPIHPFMLRYLEISNKDRVIDIRRKIDELYERIAEEGMDILYSSYFTAAVSDIWWMRCATSAPTMKSL